LIGAVVLDLKFIRENPEAVVENCKNRGVEADVDLVVGLAGERSELMQELNELRQGQNEMAKSVGKERDPDRREGLIAESRRMKEQIPEIEAQLAAVEGRLREEMLKIPNMTHTIHLSAGTTRRTSRSGVAASLLPLASNLKTTLSWVKL